MSAGSLLGLRLVERRNELELRLLFLVLQRRSQESAPSLYVVSARSRDARAPLVRVTQADTPASGGRSTMRTCAESRATASDRPSTIDRTRAAQALLAGIAERGADAVGYAHRSPGGAIVVHKQRSGASAVLDQIAMPADARQALLHVRDYTKGHPRIEANNHPVRHGAVVGIHNGHIDNDDELMARYGFARAEPEMSVDSEVIFAVAEANGSTARGFEEFRGSLATAWLDEREPGSALPRARRRPPALGRHHPP